MYDYTRKKGSNDVEVGEKRRRSVGLSGFFSGIIHEDMMKLYEDYEEEEER